MAGGREPPGQPGLGPLTCAALDQVTQWRCRERASRLAGEGPRKPVHSEHSFCGKAALKGLSGRLSAIPKDGAQKYKDYYNISNAYVRLVVQRMRQRFSPEDCARLEEMLRVISSELMPEVGLL